MNWSKPITIDNKLFVTYMIGSMESTADNDGGIGWRKYLTPMLNSRGIYAFDPTREEIAKVGLPTNEFLAKLSELVDDENYNEFLIQMGKIWKGNTYTKLENGSYEMRHVMGDINYVEYSNFLIWHHKEGDKPGGTIAELVIAWTRGIPVYLVTEMDIQKMNKSILFFLLDSGHRQGRVFKSFKGLLQFLDKKYKLETKKG